MALWIVAGLAIAVCFVAAVTRRSSASVADPIKVQGSGVETPALDRRRGSELREGHDASERAPAVRLQIGVSEAGAIDLPQRSLPQPWSVPRPAYLMEYQDAWGQITERVIRPISVERRDHVLHIVAYCYLRSDERTFRADRIRSLRDFHDGSDVVDLAAVSDLPLSDYDARAKVRRKARPGVAALLWTAVANRKPDAEAIDLLLAFAQERCIGEAEMPEGELRDWLRDFRITREEAARYMGRMPRTGSELALVRSYAARVIDALGAQAAKRWERLCREAGHHA